MDEHIGEIEDFSFSWKATMTRASENPGKEELAFEVKGSKGSGVVYIEQDKNSGQDFQMLSGVLIMPDGSSHSIDLNTTDDGGSPSEMFDVDQELAPQ